MPGLRKSQNRFAADKAQTFPGKETMQNPNPQDTIEKAIEAVADMSAQTTGGRWLEDATVAAGPHIREWDVAECYLWAEWPERELHFPDTTNQDVGIDVVAVRRSDGERIAIQCKARQLNEHGRGNPIHKVEIDKFASASAGAFWAERWLVTNGDNPLSGNTRQAMSMSDKPVKVVNIANDLRQQQSTFTHEECPHCQANPENEEPRQTRTCMQNEAVAESVRILREHERSNSGGLPVGQARGKIVLPCGAGKTRVSLRIVEELTPPGALSIVLCPSIALVAQIRREYLQQATGGIRALAVCSDETAGYDPKKESSRNTAADPTQDNSNVSASEVKGNVTTDPAEIARWIRDGDGDPRIGVIFGTYQSGHRVAQALDETGATASVLIADEAHRTAGLRRKRNAGNKELSPEEKRIRDFTLCHDNDAFPAVYRVYQTATPRVYDTRKVDRDRPGDWVVRSMDDETVFGVELYRKSYVEAVKNGWLSDYRIIAMGVNDPEAYQQANLLASNTRSKGRRALTSTDYLRGLAFTLALGGATQGRENGSVPVKSCIAFMNTVDKSKNMADDLQTDAVRKWLQDWLRQNREGQSAARYTLEHLDAASNVTARDNAKENLAKAGDENPHAIINVGIFGEGTDSPSLSAVAFLEPRKSPIDVIQAVGRAMRTSPGKEMGYIICPILIPPNADPETWLSSSGPEDGWQELGQILLALRAHDQRIEDNLAELLQLYVPTPPPTETAIVAIANEENRRVTYGIHTGPPGEAPAAVKNALEGESRRSQHIGPLVETAWRTPTDNAGLPGGLAPREPTENHTIHEPGRLPYATQFHEPTMIVTGKKNSDGSLEIRRDVVQRGKPAPDGTPGPVDVNKSKAKAKKMINDGEGVRVNPDEKRPRRSANETRERNAMQLLPAHRHGRTRQRHQDEPPRQVRPGGQPRGQRLEHPGIERPGSRPPSQERRPAARPGPALRPGQPGPGQAQGPGRRLRHRRPPDDERRHAPPAHRQRALAFRGQRPGNGQERRECNPAGQPGMEPNHAPRLPPRPGNRRSRPSKPSRTPASSAAWNAPCATSPPRPSASPRPTPTWAPTTPAPCSTASWATRPATAPSSPARWPLPSPPA